jgi:hypothetical protein
MPTVLWSQDVFTKGELSPLMYARASVNAYFNGVKLGKNCITYPQGGIGKRFGTLYVNEITGITTYDEIKFEAFPYLNECIYLLVWTPATNGTVHIFLEGYEVGTVTGTGLDERAIQSIDSTILDNIFRVAFDGNSNTPKDLVRTSNAANAITGFTGAPTNTLTLTNAITADQVLPCRFTTGTSLPTTDPQVKTDITYFTYSTSTTEVEIYSSATDAAARTNAYTITGAGTAANVVHLNTWTVWDIDNASYSNVISKYPVYDFDGGYDSYYFTLSATTGSAVTISCFSDAAATTPQAFFTAEHVGGAVVGNSGTARITAQASTTATIDVLTAFSVTTSISGNVYFIGVPAWSDTRGWPRKCSSYQNRAVFANTESLPNGMWLSALNGYDDFDTLEQDPDNAIAYFPTSDNVNYIRFIVPYRSLTVHTVTGIYSTPPGSDLAITPQNFSLSLQDSTPATDIQPRAIDNQIIIVSGDDVHTLLWDGYNNAYNSTMISVISEHLIDNPHDEAPYRDLNRAGSRYMFLVNGDGTLPIYQTLVAEEVTGWTSATVEQSYGTAKFRWTTSSPDGRAWFVVEREIAEADTPVAISGFDAGADTLTATGVGFSTTTPTACKFTTAGTLPTTSPQIATGTYYWAVGVDANDFKVYPTLDDATAGTNIIEISSAGTSSNVEPWILNTKFYIEEVSFSVYTDCTHQYSGAATGTLTGLARFNAQDVQINGDGYGFEAIGEGDEVEIMAHGEAVQVSEASVGFPIDVQIKLMPLSISGGNIKSTNLVDAKHVRNATFMFADTVDGTINGVPIVIDEFDDVQIGAAPTPKTGIYQQSVMKGWNDFKNNTFTIDHNAPFDMKLLGVFYKVEVSL